MRARRSCGRSRPRSADVAGGRRRARAAPPRHPGAAGLTAIRKRSAPRTADRYHRAVPKPGPSKSKLKRGAKAVPWAVLLRGGVIVGRRWAALSAKERARLTELVRSSRGRLGSLSPRERTELGRLARKLDLGGMSRELTALARGKRSRRRGRR